MLVKCGVRCAVHGVRCDPEGSAAGSCDLGLVGLVLGLGLGLGIQIGLGFGLNGDIAHRAPHLHRAPHFTHTLRCQYFTQYN